MPEDMSLVSLKELTNWESSKNGSTSIDEVVEKINAVQSVSAIIQSRILFYRGKILQGSESYGGNNTQGNVTSTQYVLNENVNYTDKLEHLWNVTEAVHIKTEMLKIAIFNNISQSIPDASSLLSDPRSSLPKLPRLLSAIDDQKNLCQARENEQQKYLEMEDSNLSLATAVNEKIRDNADSQMHEEQLTRMKKLVAHTKCARAIINCFLSEEIDFLKHPELLDVKIKSRTPQVINF